MKTSETVTLCRGPEILMPDVRLANRFGSRLRGLMFYRKWPGIDGLLIFPCNSIHMFWMSFPLDILYLDRDGRILRTIAELAPNKIGPTVKKAFFVLELPAGSIAAYRFQPGQMLRWDANHSQFEEVSICRN